MTAAGFMQKGIRMPMRLILWIVCGLSVKGGDNFKNLKSPFIIMSNHTSYMDSFIAGSAIPFFKYLKYPPTRFMTYRKFIVMPFVGIIIKLFGAYPIERHSGKPVEEVLFSTMNILKKGELIMIYPEGKLPKNPSYDKNARSGVAYLAKSSGLPVLPAAIKRRNRKFFLPKFQVIFGSPFFYKDIAEDGEDLKSAAQKMMEKVWQLR